MAQPGSGAIPGARASPHGAEQQPCHGTDTQPHPRMAPGHQLGFPAPKMLLTSWLVSLSGLILCLQHCNCPNSANCPLPVAARLSQRVKPTPSAQGRGTLGLLALQRSPWGRFGCKHTGTETLPPLPTQGQGQVWSLCSCTLTLGRTGMAPRQAGEGPTHGGQSFVLIF